MHITVTEEDNKKTFTVELGKTRKTRDFKVYNENEIVEVLKEKYNLTGYVITEGTSKISRYLGSSTGTYVFVKTSKANTTATSGVKKVATKKPTTKTSKTTKTTYSKVK